MKNYLLVIFVKVNSAKVCKDLAVSLTPLVDSPFMKFNHMEGSIIFHFASEVDSVEIMDYVTSLLYGTTESFILTEVNDKLLVSLPKLTKEHLFDLHNEDENVEMRININREFEDDDEDYDESYVALLLEEIKGRVKKPSLDYILEKIKSNGIDSLSQFEKDTLEEYSK